MLLVVDDRGRDDQDVALGVLAVGVHDVAEDAQAGRPQLARPGAPSLDVPLEVLPLDHFIAKVTRRGFFILRGLK